MGACPGTFAGTFSEQVPHGKSEAREHLAAIENVAQAQHDRLARCRMDAGRFWSSGPTTRPREPRSGSEVLFRLRGDFGLGRDVALGGGPGGSFSLVQSSASATRVGPPPT